MNDVRRKQGDTYPILATIRGPRGRVFDLTGAVEPQLNISTTSDGSALVVLKGSVEDAAKGQVTFPVTQLAADLVAGSYYAEIQFAHQGGLYTTETFPYAVEKRITTP